MCNPSKYVVIHVTRARTAVPSEYQLHGQILESAGSSNYMGVQVSDNLFLSSHDPEYLHNNKPVPGVRKAKHRD